MRKSLTVGILLLLFIPIVFSFSSVNIASGGGSTTNNYINQSNITNILGVNTVSALNSSIIVQNGTQTNLSVNQNVVQYRVNDSCASGSSIRVINADGTVTCETDSSGTGTVTQIDTGFGLLGGPITTTGTLTLDIVTVRNNLGNFSQYQSVIFTNISGLQNGLNTINATFLSTYMNVTNLQTSNASVYSILDILNNSLNGLNTGATNNITALRNGMSAINFTVNGGYINTTGLQNGLTTVNNSLIGLNSATVTNLSTKAFAGNCPTGQFIQNTSATAIQCFTPATSGGGVTSVATGFGLLGGTITTTGTIVADPVALVGNFGNFSAYQSVLFTNISGLQDGLTTVNGTLNTFILSSSDNITGLRNGLNSVNTTLNAVTSDTVNNITGLRNGLNALNSTLNGAYVNITGLQNGLTAINNSLIGLNTGATNNITALRNGLDAINSTVNGGYVNMTGVQNGLVAVNNSLVGLNSATVTNLSGKSATGTASCPSGQFVQNFTLSTSAPTSQCFTPPTSAGGGITSLSVDSSLIASSNPITTTGTISSNRTYDYGIQAQPRNQIYKQVIDFESTTAGYTTIWIPTAIASGTAPVATAIDWTHLGILNITVASGTTGSGYAFQQSNAGAFRLTNNSYFWAVIQMQCQASSINLTELRVGYQDVFTAGAPVDGIYFNITANNLTNQFNVTPTTRNNSVQTIGTTYVANCNEWYSYSGYVNNLNSVTFDIWNVNGTRVNTQTLTSNIPWQVGRETSSAIVGYTRGARYTTLGHSLWDYFEIGVNQTLVR